MQERKIFRPYNCLQRSNDCKRWHRRRRWLRFWQCDRRWLARAHHMNHQLLLHLCHLLHARDHHVSKCCHSGRVDLWLLQLQSFRFMAAGRFTMFPGLELLLNMFELTDHEGANHRQLPGIQTIVALREFLLENCR